MKTELTFQEYLIQQGLTPQTIRTYLYEAGFFLQSNPQADTYQYKDILDYFAGDGSQYKTPGYRSTILAAIKKYYDYLVEIGKRNDHPCRRLFFKRPRHNQVIANDLFTSQELELLMQRKERYKDMQLRNQLIISLLIYQGLAAGEIAGLKTTHIDLDKGTIFLKGNKKIARRHLELVPRQYRLADRYLNECRPKLMREKQTDTLILNKLGSPVRVDDINYLVETFKPLFPDRNLNPKTIRQSVITNWLNEKKIPLEQVQLLAGHRWPSSTAFYRQMSAEEERELINRYHPLG